MAQGRAIQDFYADEIAICYGCGRHNPQGMGIKTCWNGKEGICRYTPDGKYTAFPGVVYGGTLASLIDCHSIGTAIAALYDHEGREPGSEPEITCVTANLNVDFLKPTPVGLELMLRSRIKEIMNRKVIVETVLYVGDVEHARGSVVAVRVPTRKI